MMEKQQSKLMAFIRNYDHTQGHLALYRMETLKKHLHMIEDIHEHVNPLVILALALHVQTYHNLPKGHCGLTQGHCFH
jgi:hypothetical protein